jgi:hypothetical protein
MDIELKQSYQKKKPLIKIQTHKMNFQYESTEENINQENEKKTNLRTSFIRFFSR